MKIRRLWYYIKNDPYQVLDYFTIKCARLLTDRCFVKLYYRARFHKKLNLDNPQTYSEKLQWLKLYNRKPEYTTMVDKLAVKKYVASIIGEEFIIPTIAVYESVEEIDFDKLPNQFVLKCTHDSGGVVICKDKCCLDIEATKQKLKKGLETRFDVYTREWPYRNVKPRIIAEEYMVDDSGVELKDYKWFCFDGQPKALFIATDRGNPTEDTKFDFFDMDFTHLPFTNGHPHSNKDIMKPCGFEKMKEIASMLSQNIPHVRVDLYDINGKIYFGELTFFHWSGFVPFDPEEWDYTFGSWIKLPQK